MSARINNINLGLATIPDLCFYSRFNFLESILSVITKNTTHSIIDIIIEKISNACKNASPAFIYIKFCIVKALKTPKIPPIKLKIIEITIYATTDISILFFFAR